MRPLVAFASMASSSQRKSAARVDGGREHDVVDIRKWLATVASCAAVTLAACGGGGGDSSDSTSVRVVNATLTHTSIDVLANGATAVAATPIPLLRRDREARRPPRGSGACRAFFRNPTTRRGKPW